jgi:hypothetical protein
VSGDRRTAAGAWGVIVAAVSLVRLLGAGLSSDGVPAPNRGARSPQVFQGTGPAVQTPGGGKDDAWVVLVRRPGRKVVAVAAPPPGPAKGPVLAPPDMEALVRRAREAVGKGGALVPPLEPPPRAPPKP